MTIMTPLPRRRHRGRPPGREKEKARRGWRLLLLPHLQTQQGWGCSVPSVQADVIRRQHRDAATLQKPGKKDEVCDNNRRTHRPLPAAPSPLPPRLARRGNQANSKPDGGKVETSLADWMQMRQPGDGGGGGLNRLRMASRGAAG